MILAELEPFNETGFRRESRDLDLLASGDYTPVATEIRRLYPNAGLDVRAIPFAERYVAELTGRYSRPVVRRFLTGRDSDATAWAKLQRVYSDSDLDAVWAEVERSLAVQRSLVLLPIPDSLGRVRVLVCRPWQVDVECPDPLRASDPAAWSKLVVAVPTTMLSGQVCMGLITVTPTSAWRTVGGSNVGLYAPDGSNPFSRVPAVVIRSGDPYIGKWHGPVNSAVRSLQLILSLQDADNDSIIRNCAFPQWVIENATKKQSAVSVQMGPNKVIALVRDADSETAPGPVLRAVQGQVPVAELSGNLEAKIRLYCSLLGMDPSAFIRVNTSVTASARLFQAQDRKALRDKTLPAFERAERDLARVIAELLARTELVPLPYRDLLVTVEYHEPIQSADPLHDAQADAARVGSGQVSVVDLVAQANGISRPEARRLVERNLAEGRALGLVPSLPSVAPAEGVTQ